MRNGLLEMTNLFDSREHASIGRELTGPLFSLMQKNGGTTARPWDAVAHPRRAGASRPSRPASGRTMDSDEECGVNLPENPGRDPLGLRTGVVFGRGDEGAASRTPLT